MRKCNSSTFRRLLVGVAGASGMFAGVAVSSADLVHRYSFNDGTANDSVGTANGTLTGGATIASGQLTTGGASGDYVSLPASVGTGITGDFTIEDFVTLPTNPNNYSSLFSLSSTGNRNFFLVNPSRPGSGNLSANFQQTPQGNPDIEKDLAAGSAFPFGTAEHDVALTYVASSNIVTVYVDGVSVASGSIASAISPGTSLSLQALTSGGSNGINGNGPFGDQSLNGSTDEFRVYNAALSGTQVAANFVAGPNVIVPEPTTLGLAGLASVFLVGRRRNRLPA